MKIKIIYYLDLVYYIVNILKKLWIKLQYLKKKLKLLYSIMFVY